MQFRSLISFSSEILLSWFFFYVLFIVSERQICDSRTEFDCNSMSSDNCITLTHVCNGHRDCSDGEDEVTEICAAYNMSGMFSHLFWLVSQLNFSIFIVSTLYSCRNYFWFIWLVIWLNFMLFELQYHCD